MNMLIINLIQKNTAFLKKLFAVILYMIPACICISCTPAPEASTGFLYEYGVFLNLSPETAGYEAKLANYHTVVIDAQYFSKDEIKGLKDKDHIVYSYLNIGSIENFRNYFNEYKSLILSNYENWDEEYWIDVSDPVWKDFITDRLAPSLLEKGVDGLFIDNVDIYYQYRSEKIYNSVTDILKRLKSKSPNIIINGGDTFISRYIDEKKQPADILSGINQETVFTAIDFEKGSFRPADIETQEYFTDYLKKAQKQNIDIFLLEYTNDDKLRDEIKHYCDINGYLYYISSSIELN